MIAVPQTHELQLHSEGRAVRLCPADSSALMVALLEVLDGDHTVEDIVDHLIGFGQDRVLASLYELVEARLVEEADVSASPLHAEQQEHWSEQLLYFSQFDCNPDDAQTLLANSRIVVIGGGTVQSALLTSLAESGIGELVGVSFNKQNEHDYYFPAVSRDLAVDASFRQRLEQCNPWLKYQHVVLSTRNDRNILSEITADSAVVVVALDHHDPGLLASINELCVSSAITWMSIGLSATEGCIGPVVVPGQTACYSCFDRRRKANLPFVEPYLLYEAELRRRPPAPSYGRLPQFGRVIADLAAIDLVKLLTNFAPAIGFGRFITVDFQSLEMKVHNVLKLPRCEVCGLGVHALPLLNPWAD